MIVYNTKDVWLKPQWDIMQASYYYIHDCQFNDTGDYGGKSCIDFQDGDGSQFIDVYSCIVTYGKGYWGGGIYFKGNFDFNIKKICIYACQCFEYGAIAVLKSSDTSKYNLTYLTSSQCLPKIHPLYMKNFQEFSSSNVSFTPAPLGTYGIVRVESVHAIKKYNYNSFCNNTSSQSIVYFFDMKFSTKATHCNCLYNKAETYSIIIYHQNSIVNDINLHLKNFFIFGNQFYNYYTYEAWNLGKIFVENCSSDNHKASKAVIFVDELVNVTNDSYPIYKYYGTFACDVIQPIDEVSFQTPLETAHQTPFITLAQSPMVNPVIPIPDQIPQKTLVETPFQTFSQTPDVTERISNSVDKSNYYINLSDSPNDSNKLINGKWIIIAASLSAIIIAVIVLSIYIYRKRISKQNESDSEIEMVEETVITSKENISLTIENPLFTTTINGSDDPFKSAFEDSEIDGVFYITEN
ncbi:hypothetical protein TVAG_087520 [Trichomonas vaginalis G3]|uniref:Uncharacterized protein n=1 Tax=Trichomonas vaginalis (strain ATCC PRA-98 / G3) TaxID=412133 RepID=A2FDS8_TRIV3|nr:bifunctional inhibitor/lipid-transfer protein/seed storage 2s albumin superfamily protein family [Trichomonas vaginalis G3]EAX96927.1 hypothetical protein TVAG_087520 [Trichomonas vaginalis G3]KAI5532626.1 bifunctional inhibitor/lipid-transfer protein/seed storage 2s albumin superfamily protein family [Trichomonas vaginalis G3]|eukprot:XP_001309857.1 hypothetical protein [Trichomonas vaginalis G3]